MRTIFGVLRPVAAGLMFLMAPAGVATAQSPEQTLPSAATAQTISAVDVKFGSDYIANIGLYSCSILGSTIKCLLLLKGLQTHGYDYDLDYIRSRLIDNFNDQHNLTRSYFLNGRGQERKTVNLGKDDVIWFGLEFDGATPDISSIRVVFDRFDRAEVRGPIDRTLKVAPPAAPYQKLGLR